MKRFLYSLLDNCDVKGFAVSNMESLGFTVICEAYLPNARVWIFDCTSWPDSLPPYITDVTPEMYMLALAPTRTTEASHILRATQTTPPHSPVPHICPKCGETIQGTRAFRAHKPKCRKECMTVNEKFIIRGIKAQLLVLRKGILAKGGTVPTDAVLRLKIFDQADESGLQTCDEYRVPFSILEGFKPGDVNT